MLLEVCNFEAVYTLIAKLQTSQSGLKEVQTLDIPAKSLDLEAQSLGIGVQEVPLPS